MEILLKRMQLSFILRFTGLGLILVSPQAYGAPLSDKNIHAECLAQASDDQALCRAGCSLAAPPSGQCFQECDDQHYQNIANCGDLTVEDEKIERNAPNRDLILLPIFGHWCGYYHAKLGACEIGCWCSNFGDVTCGLTPILLPGKCLE